MNKLFIKLHFFPAVRNFQSRNKMVFDWYSHMSELFAHSGLRVVCALYRGAYTPGCYIAPFQGCLCFDNTAFLAVTNIDHQYPITTNASSGCRRGTFCRRALC